MSSSVLSSEKQYDENDVIADFDTGDMNFIDVNDKDA